MVVVSPATATITTMTTVVAAAATTTSSTYVISVDSTVVIIGSIIMGRNISTTTITSLASRVALSTMVDSSRRSMEYAVENYIRGSLC